MPNYDKEVAALKAAMAAGDAEANRLWERDGKIDCGSCGSACLSLKGGTKLFKAAATIPALMMGSDGYIVGKLPEGIRSQNADIRQGWYIAFRQSLIAAGYEAAIKKFWTYID